MRTSFIQQLLLAAAALGLAACSTSREARPMPSTTKPVVAAVVVYRIDDHRYFEVTPERRCYGDMLYFVDTAKGIRSAVTGFDPVMDGTTLIIDAANDQYLVAPVTRGGINCSSGGGACGGSSMPYSIDGGRTWQRAWHAAPGNDLMISQSMAYRRYRIQSFHTDALDLVTSPTSRNADWKTLEDDFVFKPRIAPVDTKVWCSTKPQGSK